MNIEKKVSSFIAKEKAVFLSDIAREFGITVYTAHDLVKSLEKEGLVEIVNKGVAKLVKIKD